MIISETIVFHVLTYVIIYSSFLTPITETLEYWHEQVCTNGPSVYGCNL